MPKRPFFLSMLLVLSMVLSACASSSRTPSQQEAARNSGSNVEVYGAIDAGIGQSKIYR